MSDVKLSSIAGGRAEEPCPICESDWHSILGCPYIAETSYDDETSTTSFVFQGKLDDDGNLIIQRGCFPRYKKKYQGDVWDTEGGEDS